MQYLGVNTNTNQRTNEHKMTVKPKLDCTDDIKYLILTLRVMRYLGESNTNKNTKTTQTSYQLQNSGIQVIDKMKACPFLRSWT